MDETKRPFILYSKFSILLFTFMLLGFVGMAQNDCYLEPELKVIQASLGSDLNGPFAPGEELTIQLNIFWNGTNCNWIHGLVPTFGEGWAASNFSANGEIALDETFTNPDFFLWYENGVTYKNFQSAIYGNGDLLPAGWYVTNTSGGNQSNCSFGQYVYDPNCSCGVSQQCNQYYLHTVEFKLTTLSYEDCISSNAGQDLSLEFKVFSDYESGAGIDASCIDIPEITKYWTVDCEKDMSLHLMPVEIFVPSDGDYEINLFDQLVVPNPNCTFRWTAIPHYQVSGASSCNNTNCGHLLSQQLSNSGFGAKEVSYQVFATDENYVSGPVSYFTVKVASDFYNYADTLVTVCAGTTHSIHSWPRGGAGDSDLSAYEYEWDSGETTHNISFTANEPSSHTVTITDEWGTLTTTYHVAIEEPVAVNITPEIFEIPCEGISPDYLSFETEALEYEIEWSGPDVTSETQHDEIIYPTLPGTYALEITDLETGCTEIIESTVYENHPIEVNITASATQVCRSEVPLDLIAATPEGGDFVGLNMNNLLVPTEIGVHTISYIVTDELSGCEFSSSIDIEVVDADLPEMNWTHEVPSEYCVGQTYTFCIDASSLSYTYAWSVPDPSTVIEVQDVNCINVTWSSSTSIGSICVEYSDSDNCLGPKLCFSDIVVLDELACATVGVVDLFDGFQIFPNPVTDYLTIISDKNMHQIEFFDVLGRKVLDRNVVNDRAIELNVADLEMGVYQLMIDGVAVEKVIVF